MPVREASVILKQVIAAFTNAGYLDIAGQSRSAVLDQVREIARALPDLDPVLDHRYDLLKLARQFRLGKKREYAVLMYATWIEHTLNLTLQELARARAIDEVHIQSFLREGSVRAKSSWLFVLLGGKPLSNRVVSRIQRLADSRNSFIHYKWNRPSKLVESDLDSTLNDAEPVVRNLQRVLRDTGLLSERSRVVRNIMTKKAAGDTK